MEIEVVNYIKEARAHGLTDLEIKQNLLKAGWEAHVVDDGFAHAKVTDAKAAEPVKIESKGLQPQKADPIKPVAVSAKPAAVPLTLAEEMPAQKKTWSVMRLSLILIVILLVLGSGAYAYFVYGFNNPSKVWDKFASGGKSNMYRGTVQFSYTDPNSLQSSTSPFTLSKLGFQFKGDFYVNQADAAKPESDSDVQYTVSYGNTSFSTGLQYILKDNVFYLNVGDNPLLSAIFGSTGNKQPWIKFDLQKLQNSSSTEFSQFNDILNANLKTDLEKIWSDTKIVKIDKYMGREKINGVNTFHFKNTLDKQALKTAFGQMADKLQQATAGKGGNVSQSDLDSMKFVVNALVDKVEIKDMETWIGATDFRLYKVHIDSNAPSLVSAVQVMIDEPLMSARNKSRDAKRIADMRQMASALELYYNDYNGYPESDGHGNPAGGTTPTYIGIIPTAPTPADGTCTDYFNSYWYQPSGTKQTINGKTVYSDYTLTFCLGLNTGGYEAGIAQLSPSGIKGNIPCPSSKQSDCVNLDNTTNTDKTVQQEIQDTIDKLQFNGTLNVDANYHDYGKTKTLTPPTDAYDVMKAIEDRENQPIIFNSAAGL